MASHRPLRWNSGRQRNPAIRIFGAEPEVANDWWLSFQAGERRKISMPPAIAGGLRVMCPGKPRCRRL